MPTLASCLKKHDFTKTESDIIKSKAKEYVSEGYKPEVANVSAVEDYIRDLKAEQKDIIAKAKKQGWAKTPVETQVETPVEAPTETPTEPTTREPIGTVWITTESKHTGRRDIYSKSRTLTSKAHNGKVRVEIKVGKDKYKKVVVDPSKVTMSEDAAPKAPPKVESKTPAKKEAPKAENKSDTQVVITDTDLVKQKKQMLAKIDEKIKDAPEYATNDVIFKIPGKEGTFTLVNDKETLQEFRKDVEKNWPKDSRGTFKPKVPRTGMISPAQRNKLYSELVGDVTKLTPAKLRELYDTVLTKTKKVKIETGYGAFTTEEQRVYPSEVGFLNWLLKQDGLPDKIKSEIQDIISEGKALYQTTTPVNFSGVSLADLKKRPWMKGRKVEITEEGHVKIAVSPGHTLVIEGLSGTDEGIQMHLGIVRGGVRTAKYSKKTVTFTQMSDAESIIHEIEAHFFEDIGLINNTDKNTINDAIEEETGVRPEMDTRAGWEARADWITKNLTNREAFRVTKLGKVLQKVADFLDIIVNLASQTERGVLRKIESGKFTVDEQAPMMRLAEAFQTKLAQDAEYLSLAKDPVKNKAELQKMVDEAAKAAGYGTSSHHGTDKVFTVFDTKDGATRKSKQQLDFGSHFGEKEYASGYSKKGRVVSAWLNLKTPLNIADSKKAFQYKGQKDFKRIQKLNELLGFKPSGDNFYDKNGVKQETVQSVNINQHHLDSKSPAKVKQALLDAGFDGVIYEPYNRVGLNHAIKHPVSYIALRPNQIKSADPVTYYAKDDQAVLDGRAKSGDAIPLSERFNPEEDSILYETKPIRPGMFTEGTIDPEAVKASRELIDKHIQRIKKVLSKKDATEVSEKKTRNLVSDYVKVKQQAKDTRVNLQKRIKDYKEFLAKLPIHIRGKAMSGMPTLLKATTPEAMEKAFAKARLTAEKHANKYFKTEAKRELHRIRKRLPETKGGKVKKSTLGSDAKRYVDIVNNFVFSGKIRTAQQSESVLASLSSDRDRLMREQPEDPVLIKAWEDKVAEVDQKIHIVNVFGGINDMMLEDIQYATEELKRVVKEGRTKWAEMEDTRKKFSEGLVDAFGKEITGEDAPQMENMREKQRRKVAESKNPILKAKRKLDQVDTLHQSWRFLMDKLAKKSGKGTLKSDTVQSMGGLAHDATNRENQLNGEAVTMMNEKLTQLTGLKGSKLKRWVDDKGNNHRDYTVYPDGKADTVPLAELDAVYWWAVHRRAEALEANGNSSVMKRLNKMGVNDKFITEVEQNTDQAVRDMAVWLSDTLGEKIWSDVNEIHEIRLGAPLTHSEAYTPIHADYSGKSEKHENLLNRFEKSPGMTKGALHELTNTSIGVKPANLFTVWIDHIYDMNHFASWALPVQTMESVLKNPATKNFIDREHGPGMNTAIEEFIDHFKTGQQGRKELLQWFDKVRANFSTAVLGINPVVYIKQLASIPAMASDIPTGAFAKGMADFMTNPVKKAKILGESQFIQTRYGKGHTRDVAIAMKQTVGQTLAKVQGMNSQLMFLTKLGDRQAIYAGGWAVYKYHFDKNKKEMGDKKAHEYALKKFEESTRDTQQSGEIMDLSLIQQRSPFTKLFTMFMTAPASYYREVSSAVRNMKGNKKDSAKRLFLFWVIVPAVFEAIASAPMGMDEDEEDRELFMDRLLRGVVLGPLNGIFIARDAIEYLYNKAWLKQDAWSGPGFTSVTQPITDAGKIVGELTKDMDEWDYPKIIEALIDIGGYWSGKPLPAAQNLLQNWSQAVEGDTEHPRAKLLGYSDYSTGD